MILLNIAQLPEQVSRKLRENESIETEYLITEED